MLHILNGSAMEETMREAFGAHASQLFSFRDALISGPVPDLSDKTAWREVRAKHLSETYDVEFDECATGLEEQEKTLQSYANHDEVVLWFEHDLFCQLNLLYLLDWFASVDLNGTTLSLVNIGEFPGHPNFRGLGELNSEELASLFPQRQRITGEHLSLGSKAWSAFRSSDPTSIENLLQTDTSTLPFLKTTLTAHLRRFPATGNGIGDIERSALELVETGHHSFKDLFPAFVSKRPVYGLGDTQLWMSLIEMTDIGEPLMHANGVIEAHEVSLDINFTLTDTGKSVLDGKSDWIKINGIDKWLGGVHLIGRDETWRWQESSGKMIRS